MSIDVVFFDLGGVILRTEYQAPREHLAERLNLSYEDLSQAVFESQSSRRASLGEISADQHWQAVGKRLGVSATQIPSIREEFFGGDVLDRELLSLIRALRQTRRTGLISNAWGDLRSYIQANRFEDAFDIVVISAEVGFLKPDIRIFEVALNRAGADPPAALLVDDAAANVDAARAMGMSAVLFRDPEQLRRDLRDHLK